MRQIYFTALFTFFAIATITNQIYAQDQSKESNKIVIVTKTVDENGEVKVERIVKTGADAEELMHFNLDDKDAGITRTIHIDVDEEIIRDGEGELHDVIVRSAGNEDIISIDISAEEMHDINTRSAGNEDIFSIDISAEELLQGKQGYTILVDQAVTGNDKGFMGVVMGDLAAKGVTLNSVVPGSGADKAGLRAGDVIAKLNNKKIKTASDVSEALQGTQNGDAVNVVFYRGGVKISDFIKLGHSMTTKFVRKEVKTFDQIKERKINCAALGVYTGTSSKTDGARIIRIIENSGAQRAGLQRNDVIYAMDNVNINNYNELHETISKYEPGSIVEVSYLREGEKMKATAVLTQWVELPEFESKPAYQAATCEELPPIENIQVVPETVSESTVFELPVDRNLQLEAFNAFPNPTAGPVTITFRGEAVPTEITLTDVNGRQVYQDKLTKFDGIYNNEINLNRIPSGNLFLNITQGEKTFTETIVRQ